MSWQFQPEPMSQQKALDFHLLKRLAPYASEKKGLLLFMAIVAPVLSLTQLIRPYLVKIVVDDVIPTKDVSGIAVYSSIYLGLMLFDAGLLYVQTYGLQVVGLSIIRTLRLQMFRRLMGQSTRFLKSRPSGVFVTRLTNDLEAIGEFFATGVITLLSDIIRLVAIAGVMLWMNYRLTIAAFIAIPVLWLLGLYFRNKLRYAYRSIRLKIAALNAFIAESLGGIETIQSVGIAEPFVKRFQRLNEDNKLANMDSIKYDASLYAIVEVLGSVATGALLWYGGGLRETNTLTFGELIAFIEYIGMFFVPIRDMSQKYAIMQSAMASTERVFGLLDSESEIPEGKLALPTLNGSEGVQLVEFEDVYFGYNHNEPVLKGISLRAERGKKIALVGATGSGKTTTLRLLLKQYLHNKGTVRINGHDVAEIQSELLRSHIAIVQQSCYLFSGSLYDNIALFDPELSVERVQKVSEDLGLLDRFNSLDFNIVEGGSNVSQGETQLISLARAIVRNPDVLILDEATSSVDPELEATVYDHARAATQNGILISVAHRLSTVIDADDIYVFRSGVVLEQGKHTALMEHNGYYARLMELQTLREKLIKGEEK